MVEPSGSSYEMRQTEVASKEALVFRTNNLMMIRILNR
jgi:hypothetical protein